MLASPVKKYVTPRSRQTGDDPNFFGTVQGKGTRQENPLKMRLLSDCFGEELAMLGRFH
jgi:hypothetical protein